MVFNNFVKKIMTGLDTVSLCVELQNLETLIIIEIVIESGLYFQPNYTFNTELKYNSLPS